MGPVDTRSVSQNVREHRIAPEDLRFAECVSHLFSPSRLLFQQMSEVKKRCAGRRMNPGLLLVAHGQLVTTLGPSSGKDISAVFCRHTLPETVGVLAFAVVRLKRSFHQSSPTIFQTKKGCLAFRQSFSLAEQFNFKPKYEKNT